MSNLGKWLLLLTVLLSGYSFAGDWMADSKGCKVWNNNPIEGETVTWSGACKDGLAEG